MEKLFHNEYIAAKMRELAGDRVMRIILADLGKIGFQRRKVLSRRFSRQNETRDQ